MKATCINIVNAEIMPIIIREVISITETESFFLVTFNKKGGTSQLAYPKAEWMLHISLDRGDGIASLMAR